jgi:hypothetical protein
MNNYQCDHTPGTNLTKDQHLDLICRGCLRGWMNRHNAMKQFVEQVSKLEGDPATTFRYYLIERANELLKELGEL